MSYEDSKFEEAKGLDTQDDDIVHMAPSNMQGLALGLGETSHVPVSHRLRTEAWAGTLEMQPEGGALCWLRRLRCRC